MIVALISPQREPWLRLIVATIASWLGLDRRPMKITWVGWSRSHDQAWSDALSPPVRWRSTTRWIVHRSMEIKHSRRLHEEKRIALHRGCQIVIARPLFWWRSRASRDATCPKVSRSSCLLNPPIEHVLVMEIGWTLCPPHRHVSCDAPWIRRPLSRHASCTGKKRVGHSPTRKKI